MWLTQICATGVSFFFFLLHPVNAREWDNCSLCSSFSLLITCSHFCSGVHFWSTGKETSALHWDKYSRYWINDACLTSMMLPMTGDNASLGIQGLLSSVEVLLKSVWQLLQVCVCACYALKMISAWIKDYETATLCILMICVDRFFYFYFWKKKQEKPCFIKYRRRLD